MADIYGFSPGLQELSDRAALTGELGVLGQIRNQAPSVPFIPRSPFPAPWGQAFDLGQFPGHSINPVQPWQSLQFRPNAGVVGQRPALAQPMGMQDMGNWQDPRGALAQVTPEEQPQQQPAPKPQQPNMGTQQPSMGTDPAAAAAAQAQHAQQSQDSDAWRWGLLAAGLGILANNSGHYGAAGPALGKGGMMGLQTYFGRKDQEQATAFKSQQLAEQKRLHDAQIREYEAQAAQREAALKKQAQLQEWVKQHPPQNEVEAIALQFAPEKYIEAKMKNLEPYTLKGGETRYSGDQKVASGGPQIPAGMYVDDQGKLGWLPGYLEGRSQVAAAGAAKNIVEVNSQLPASAEAQKQFMQEARQSYNALRSAPSTLDNIEKAKALVQRAGSFVGSGAESKLAAVKFFNNNLGTNISTDGIASAEELRSRLFMGIMDNLKKMDAQPSQMQQQAMQDALGRITTDPGALPRVLDVFGDIVRDKVSIHNQDIEGALQKGIQFPYDPRIKIPGKVETQQQPQQPGGSPADFYRQRR